MADYSFTTVTPVHVGSGTVLNDAVDYVIKNNLLYVIDIEKMFDALQHDETALAEYTASGKIGTYLQMHGISAEDIQLYRLPIKSGANPREIRTMIKTGMGKPYLPGSSIKGAIRTVLLWHLIQKCAPQQVEEKLSAINRGNAKPAWADDPLDHLLFGKDPNHDILRSLHVGDVHFDTRDMGIFGVRVMTLRQGNHLDKKFSHDTYVEGLRAGTYAKGRLVNDDFLLDNQNAQRALGFQDHQRNAVRLSTLASECNELALSFIGAEIKFFNDYKMKEMEAFYEKLRTDISSQANGAFYLHLGWGSGWHGMTGNYLDEEWVKKFRKKFNLGRRDVPVFPKTRRLVYEHDRPQYPLGWMRIEPANLKSPAEQTEKISNPAPEAETIRVTWESARLSWNPGKGEVTAVNPATQRKAGGGRKEQIPQAMASKFFKTKTGTANVVVEKLGNDFIINSIES